MNAPTAVTLARAVIIEEGRCNAAEIAMSEIAGDDRHASRCLKFADSWDAPIRPQNSLKKQNLVTSSESGRVEKYYEVAATPCSVDQVPRRLSKPTKPYRLKREGETLAIVGESGCGKSTFAKVLMGLETATDGQILLDGENIEATAIEQRDTQTVADVQMVFQNPFDTLNPSMTVGRQIIRIESMAPLMMNVRNACWNC